MVQHGGHCLPNFSRRPVPDRLPEVALQARSSVG
jgi:hypothetical protein